MYSGSYKQTGGNVKAFKIKETITQEYVSFGNTREEAIENYNYSSGHDFDRVEINGEYYVNGEVTGSKITATSLGEGNFITFDQKDWKFAKAMWLRIHNCIVRIREYDGTVVDAHTLGAEQVAQDTDIRDDIYEIADRYSKTVVTPVK